MSKITYDTIIFDIWTLWR